MAEKTRKQKFESLRENLRRWEEKLGEVHMLSPCDPRKRQHLEFARKWRDIINEDPELFYLLQEIEDFETIFPEACT